MLSDSLKILLASTQSFAIKTQNFHWNVEGSNFPQYHMFLDTLYQDVNETIDPIAEYVRVLGSYTPGSLQRYAELCVCVWSWLLRPSMVSVTWRPKLHAFLSFLGALAQTLRKHMGSCRR